MFQTTMFFWAHSQFQTLDVGIIWNHPLLLYVSQNAVDQLVKDKMPKKSGRWWFSWRRRDINNSQVHSYMLVKLLFVQFAQVTQMLNSPLFFFLLLVNTKVLKSFLSLCNLRQCSLGLQQKSSKEQQEEPLVNNPPEK